MSDSKSVILGSNSVAQTIDLGVRLGGLLQSGDVVLLSGDLGAGKTQFSKGVAQGLGIQDEITSPTFNLVLEYEVSQVVKPAVGSSASDQAAEDSPLTQKPLLLRHFDLYRLGDSSELDDIDYFGLLEDERAASLIEWGDKFLDALPQQYLKITIADKNHSDANGFGGTGNIGDTGNIGGASNIGSTDNTDNNSNIGSDSSSNDATRELTITATGQRAEQLLLELQNV
jgi:tRNA threonylcarbamoyladenosine biosynthesis protein TsaE